MVHRLWFCALALGLLAAPPSAQEAARKALRGIEKKDIRLAVLYDGAKVRPTDAQALGDAILQSPEVLAEFTKADAARGVNVLLAKQSGGDCPPAGCGCEKGAIDCFCRRLKEHCLCRLCPLSLGPSTITLFPDTIGGRLARPGADVVVLLGIDPKDARQMLEENRAEIQQTLRQTPTGTALTIKSKSSPR
ncbi:MAG: hypothetical protein ACUVS7_08710 [Bryobacteraceae bacterium]